MRVRASALRTLRLRRGLTQRQLADAAQLWEGTVTRLESGRSKGGIKSLHRIAKALNVTIDDIVDFGEVEEAAS